MGGYDRGRAAAAAREAAAICAVVAFAAIVLYVLGIGCPIKFITGVSCPGCGMTRAWLEALQLHLDRAVCYHPLFWVVPAALVVGAVHTCVPSKATLVLLVVMIAALVVLWAVRMADPCDLELISRAAGPGVVVNVSAPRWAALVHLHL